MASFTVVYDACVLFPAALRDLLMRLAVADLCQARWTEDILDETFENLKAARPDLNPERLAVTRQRMCEAVPACLVDDYEDLIPSLDLPDPDDRHVLAAAICCGARVIVTENVRDFPAEALEAHGIEALTADDFVLKLLGLEPEEVLGIVRRQAATLKNPPGTAEMLLTRLERQGLKRAARKMRRWIR